MEFAVVILVALACSTAMSVLAFMIGRCGRKLPIDGMLPESSTPHSSTQGRRCRAQRWNTREPAGPPSTRQPLLLADDPPLRRPLSDGKHQHDRPRRGHDRIPRARCEST
jgi:hypothetical protein